MGTPAFAAESLESMLAAGYRIVAAVTRPDAARGRGLRPQPSAVKLAAGARGVPVMEPDSLKDPRFLELVAALGADIVVVVAFSRLLPPQMLGMAPRGAVNLHASLLPKYRGAAPVAWAIAAGERETGVTTMRMVERLDAGDVLLQRSTPIGAEETAGQLETRLAAIGAELLVETLAQLRAGTVTPVRQDESAATYAPRVSKQDGLIDWGLGAAEIARRVRAFDPWPVAQTALPGPERRKLLIWRARPAGETPAGATPGTILSKVSGKRPGEAGGLLVACGGGTGLLLIEVQPEGRRRMPALDAVSGRYMSVGDRLGYP